MTAVASPTARQLELHDPVMITVEFTTDRSRPRDQAAIEVLTELIRIFPQIVDAIYRPDTMPVAS